ncbi:GNAT family N-acetyltransferase [Enterococcus pingfangensis]|uniref:GNAT family N-acetyltransferase n=1 Tax=Enterococcus pingfangensis TaxID=2559924 RepID=UPI0010F9F74C|nr:GNAT family N-acetyltransferase [Enterococcus pingfangensis]
MTIHEVTEVWQLFLVYQIRQQAFVKGQQIPIEKEFDEVYGKNYHYVLLETDGEGIGCARINLSHKNIAKIERVAIAPSFQKQGFGRQLIEAAETVITKAGYRKITITSQVQAKGFYEALGYQITDPIPKGAFIPTVTTEKIISE